ncbi:MAG: L,D-transpeptidase family protein [Planctomycetes bacterium]|nr:L,D-transpeptidase family protein [Planctomycetota bacterium]
MARRSRRLRSRRRPQQRWRYIVLVVLIVGVGIAIKYGFNGNDTNPEDVNGATLESNMSEVEEKVQEVAKEPEPEPLPIRLPQPPPELIPEPEPEPEKKSPVVEMKPVVPDIAPVRDFAPNSEAASLIAEAETLLSEKPERIIEAREKLTEVFRMPLNKKQREYVKEQLWDLSDKWLFDKTIYPDDKLCGTYKVKPGDLLSTIAKKYKVPWEILLGINKISRPEVLRAGDTIKVVNGPFHVRVDRSSFVMDLYLQDKTFVRSFRVGLGKPGRDTPTGLWRVKAPGKGKLISPPWPDPDTGKMYYAEDPDYPLGSRWIGLDGLEGNAKGRTGFGIHGTKDPDQIGKADSRGCIRMYNGEVKLIYDLLVEGISTVRVVE